MRSPIRVLVAASVLLLACGEAAPPARGPARRALPGAAAPPPPEAGKQGAGLASGLASKIDPVFAAFPPNGPGCSVGVFREGEVLFAGGYGAANLEHDVKNGPETVFELASVSKHVTATAILLLVQDGKLTLEDDVRRFLPELPAFPRPVTLRHLLLHTGGLREYDALLDLSGYEIADVAREPEALRLLAMQKGVNFPAGEEWSYSNTGYFLLGQIVGRVSGSSLARFSRERIFLPLGMTATSILDDHERVVPRRATGYRRTEGGFAIAMSNREACGEGNIQTSIADLARWDGNFHDPKVGGAAWLAAMRTPGTTSDGRPTRSTLGGLLQGTFAGRATEEHSGGWAGYRTFFLRVPGEHLSVALLCNSADADPGALARATLAAVLPPEERDAKVVKDVAPMPTTLSAAEREKLLGTYLDPIALDLRTLEADGEGVRLGFGGGRAPVPLVARGATRFVVAGVPTEYEVEPAAGGRPGALIRSLEGKRTRFARVIPPTTAPSETAFAEYRGRYTSDETTRDVVIAPRAHGLSLAPLGKLPPEDDVYESVARDVFVQAGGGLRFERDGGGRVTGFVVHFDRHPAVRFRRANPR